MKTKKQIDERVWEPLGKNENMFHKGFIFGLVTALIFYIIYKLILV